MEHLNQIQRAIDFIEERLQDPLDIGDIARAAGFSMWHFQRVFATAVGQTTKEYIRKRRLSASLENLEDGRKRVLDIALEAGFESQEAYTRAFKTLFGKNPGECRKVGVRSLLMLSKPRITYDYLEHLHGGLTMQPRYENLGEKTFVGMSANFISVMSPDANNFQVIPALWDKYLARSKEIRERASWAEYGVCAAVPDAASKKHPDECFYLAGAEVKHVEEVPAGMQSFKVPAGRYAVFVHKGSLEKLGHTMSYIYGSWIAQSGAKLREAPDLEVYTERFKMGAEDSELDIYIPVV